MSDFFKKMLSFALPVAAGFAAGLAAAALVTRSGVIEMGDAPESESNDGQAAE